MTKTTNQNVSAGGDAVGNVQVAGDNNRVVVKNLFKKEAMPAVPSEVVQSLDEISTTLLSLKSEDKIKIENALREVAHEVEKENPDAEEVEDGLARAIKTAKKAEGFLDIAQSLVPKLQTIGTWLGAALGAATVLL